MNLRRNAGHDPWSCTPSRKGYKRQDQGSVGRVRDCTGSGPLVKLQASGDSTANSTRGRVEEPEAASAKLQA